MIIYSIVVYNPANPKETFSASLNGSFLKANEQEQSIKKEIIPALQITTDKGKRAHGKSRLIHENAVYYSHVTKEKIAIFAVNEVIGINARDELFRKIDDAFEANDKELLQKFITDPDMSAKTKEEIEQMEFQKQMQESNKKIQKIKTEIDETRQVMTNVIGKVIDRGEKIEKLLPQSENLLERSKQFKQHSTKLRRDMQCPTSFFGLIFFPVTLFKNTFWKGVSSYDHEDEPELEQSSTNRKRH